jgi:hypothetical protein
MFKYQNYCWILYVTDVLTSITHVYSLSEHIVVEFEFLAIVGLGMYNIIYPNIYVVLLGFV